MSIFKQFTAGHFFKLLAIVMIVIGIIPWENYFELDIRNENVLMLKSGGLLFGGLVLLQFIYLLKAFSSEGKRRGIKIIFLTAGVLLSSFLLCLSAVFYPDVWQDRGIYQNGDNYIIVQFNAFGITGERTVWRLIETQQPDVLIRHIKIIRTSHLRQQLDLPEFGGDYIKPIPALKWNNNTWRLVGFD